MKRLLSLTLVFALFLSLAGVPLASAEGEPVTITFMSHIYKPWNDLLTAQAQEFMELNPGVTVEYATVEHADLSLKLLTSLAAGSAPDVMGVYGPWMTELVRNGWLDPAPDYVTEDIRNNTVAVAGEAAEFDGQLYGYIQHIGMVVPIINRGLYDQAGAQAPTTYEDLVALNKEQLDVYDGGVLRQAGTVLPVNNSGSWMVIDWSSILRSYGGSILSEDNTAAAFNSEAGVKATEIYMDLAHADFIEDSFVQGFAAMEWSGSYQRSSYQENNPELVYEAVAPLSGPEGAHPSMYAWFWCVAADSPEPNKEAAWKFINYLSSDEKYLEMSTKVGFISFRTANYEDEAYASDEWISTFADALQIADVYYEKIPRWEEIDTAIGIELERVVVGELDIPTALANAEAAVNAILQEQ